MKNIPIIRIIGIGNSMAGDDAVGTQAVRKLREYGLPGVELIEAGPAGLSLLEFLEKAGIVIIIDAVRSGAPAGKIIRLVLPKDLELFSDLSWNSAMPSTHLIGLGEALSMGNTLGLLPQDLVVYGIEMGETQMGTDLSKMVSRAVDSVAIQICQEVEQRSCMNCN